MKTPEEIKAEILALKNINPEGRFKARRQSSINWMLEELEFGVDDTAGEWAEMADYEREAVMEARAWKSGHSHPRPSQTVQ